MEDSPAGSWCEQVPQPPARKIAEGFKMDPHGHIQQSLNLLWPESSVQIKLMFYMDSELRVRQDRRADNGVLFVCLFFYTPNFDVCNC